MSEVVYLLSEDEQAALVDIIERCGLTPRLWLTPLRRDPEAARLMMQYYRHPGNKTTKANP